MSFIANGDYNFPFDVQYYWMKLVYIWSYQTGSANPDGIIRLPGRFLDLLVFALMGNIHISLFYIFSCFAIVFLAFYCYSKYFLKINKAWLSIVAALFFTINPIFLGNASKIGLVLAAAMLPLCLVVIQKAFEKQQLRYLLLWIACLNISLIHPFIFTINVVVSGGYLLYQAFRDKPFIIKNIPKLILIVLIGLLLNAYFLLPIANIGTVNKDVLSSSVGSAPTDYSSLIDVANTGDIFTGLALAKGVLKDYEFYNDSTQLLYFVGVFTFYVVLFGVYVWVEKKLSMIDRKRFVWALAGFLVLVLLAAVNYLFVKDLIKLVVTLPGGWIFRSPLKWQLYIPFMMASMLVIALSYVIKKPHKIGLVVVLVVSFIGMNGFIGTDVFHKLLLPREVGYFGALQQKDLNQKNLLIINDESCFTFASDHPAVMTELNQILISKNVQVKQMGIDVADTVNISSYDYVLGCQGIAEPTLRGYNFSAQETFANDAFQLYANNKPKPYVYTNQNVFGLGQPQQIGAKYKLATTTLQSDFDFTDISTGARPTTYGLQDAYENVTFNNLKGSTIQSNLQLPPDKGTQALYLKNSDNLQYSLTHNALSLTPVQQQGHQPLGATGSTKVLDVPQTDKLDVTYTNARYDSVNILPNPSLEQGPWQQQVGDCYAYGEHGDIKMTTNTSDKTNGKQSLQLEAQNHVACTGPNDIPVQADQQYLLSFDYKTINGRFGAYYISFDDEAGTSHFTRLNDSQGNWATMTKTITVPSGAHALKLLVYAYPDNSGINTGLARYDNFQLTAIPNVQDHFYLLSAPKRVLQAPKEVSYKVTDPTKTTIHVKGVTSAFYLETKESYSPRWNLSLAGGKSVSEKDHIKINNYMNGWLVDPSILCDSSCVKNGDGSYDMTLVMTFTPQRWLYVGGAISGATLLATIGYFIYERRHRRSQRQTPKSYGNTRYRS